MKGHFLVLCLEVVGVLLLSSRESAATVARPIIRPPPLTTFKFKDRVPLQEPNCNLDPALVAEIKGYEFIANLIITTVVNGPLRGKAYDELAKFVDKHVNRLTGTQELEDSIDYMMEKMVADGLVNVRGEPCQVPRWIRGEEKAVLVEPSMKKIDILGLGPSVGTPISGISAEVLAVKSFEDLDAKKDLVPGKIVVYNQGWLGTYGQTAVYRGNGPVRAAEYGAVAALIESAAPFSLDTPHTGGTNYVQNVTKIPAACITKEDAEMFYRMQLRGDRMVLNLTMLDEELAPVTSRNVFGEITGREFPDEIVAVSGHIDAWDVGQGAMDDAGGVMISAESLAVIKYLGLTPRRTLQTILWTAEEFGLVGVQAWVNEHKTDMIKYNAVFESDSGTFKPLGLDFAGSEEASCIVKEILQLLAPINATVLRRFPSVSSDISFMISEGVPGLSLNNENDQYFFYHHSPADMLTVQDPVEMDLDTALWAVVSYVLADLSVPLPREPPAAAAASPKLKN